MATANFDSKTIMPYAEISLAEIEKAINLFPPVKELQNNEVALHTRQCLKMNAVFLRDLLDMCRRCPSSISLDEHELSVVYGATTPTAQTSQNNPTAPLT